MPVIRSFNYHTLTPLPFLLATALLLMPLKVASVYYFLIKNPNIHQYVITIRTKYKPKDPKSIFTEFIMFDQNTHEKIETVKRSFFSRFFSSSFILFFTFLLVYIYCFQEFGASSTAKKAVSPSQQGDVLLYLIATYSVMVPFSLAISTIIIRDYFISFGSLLSSIFLFLTKNKGNNND